MIWDHAVYFVSRTLAIVWFAGAILLLITIPACMCKIFSALWLADDASEAHPVQEPYGAQVRFSKATQAEPTG